MKWPKLPTKLIDFLSRKPKAQEIQQSSEPIEPQEVAPPEVEKPVEIVPEKHSRLPKNLKETTKFTRNQRLEILFMIAKHLTNAEIIQEVNNEMGMTISAAGIATLRNSKRWKPELDKMREFYLSSLESVPGYHKKVRLQRADDIYQVAIKNGELKNALLATEQQRREIEDKGQNPVSFVFQQYNGMTKEELEDRYNEALAKVEAHRKKHESITIGESDGVR